MKIKLLRMIVSILMIGIWVGCSEEDEMQQNQYGYVQFKLYKSGSFDDVPQARGVDELDLLDNAKKIEVIMQHEGSTISQSLVLNAYNEANAEFGLRSDKLQLLVGDYVITGYNLYDNLDNQLLSSEVEDNAFTVVGGGLTSKALPVEVTERGMASFKLVKEFVKARATAEDAYPFSSIQLVDLSVRNTFTQEVVNIKSIPVKYTEDFKEGSTNESLYPGENAETSYILCDTVVWMKAGTYQISSYTTYSDKKGNSILEVNTLDGNRTFTVKDNQLTKEVEVPVQLSEMAEYIKDYIALKEIWEALDGPNWSYAGEVQKLGVNWNFNKDIDMWGIQPGVQLHNDGRIASITLEDFGAKGVVPDAIGQLTKLAALFLGSHSETLGGHIISQDFKLNMTSEERTAMRMNYDNRVLARDFREGFSDLMQNGFNTMHPEKSIKSNRIDMKSIQFGDLTNGITGISKAMMRLTELEQLYIANSPLTSDGFFREIEASSPFYAEKDELSWSNLTKLYDLEIYNCPKLTALPMEMLGNIPELQMLNIACNKGISGEQLKADWETFINSPSGSKIQVIYMGYNNLEEFPEHEQLKKMIRLGMLDCASNKVKKVHPFGKDVNLTKLYLDYNEITEIPHAEDGYFFGYVDVESFTCTHNKITVFPDIFNAKSIHVMASVDFSYNQISEFENGENYRGINVSQLNLSNNRLKEFPSILFKKGSPLNYLVLSGNGMTTIPNGSMEGKYTYMLEALDLSHNKLTKLSDDFYTVTLPYLTGIDLSYNCFSKFPTSPLGIATLQQFHIRHQRDEHGNRCLREWPTGLYTCPSMFYFTIGSNDLRKIEDTISPYIRMFEIKDNPNISIDLTEVCDYIAAGYYMLIYDKTQDIRGCNILDLEK